MKTCVLNLPPVTLGYVTSSADKRQRGGDCIYTNRRLLSTSLDANGYSNTGGILSARSFHMQITV